MDPEGMYRSGFNHGGGDNRRQIVQILSAHNIVPICLCKAISAVMLETRARTWGVGKEGQEQNGA